jgi:pilus assembly protein CpaE
MNSTAIITLGIILLIVFLAFVGLIMLIMRRRGANTADKPEASKEKPKKSSHAQSPAKQPAPKQAMPNGKSPSTPVQQTGKGAAPASLSARPLTLGPLPPGGGKEIRLLIVDDNPGTRENVSRLLYFEEDIEVVGQAINGQEGVNMAIELKPHIVLMDINMPDMDGITATREMSVKAPFSQVIIMSVQSDQHYMKQAMAAGARDFQPKPFTSEELVNCIRRVYKIGMPRYQQLEAAAIATVQQAMQPAMTTTEGGEMTTPVIAVYSPKGGVGTSAIAANLAVALHQAHGDIVLMDGDLQFGDVLVHLNTRPTRTISDLIQQDQFEVDLLGDILLPHETGLKLLLAPPQPELADIIPPAIVTEVISSLKKQFKAVVVDTNKGLKEITLNILEAADYILVVLAPELPAIKSVKLFLEVIEQLEFDLSRVSVVINQADKPGGIKLEKIEEVLAVDHTYRIPYDPKLHFALSKGLSICQQDSGAPSARAITNIARQLWAQMSEPKAVGEMV